LIAAELELERCPTGSAFWVTQGLSYTHPQTQPTERQERASRVYVWLAHPREPRNKLSKE